MAVEDIAVLTSEVQKTDNIETAFDNFEKKRVNRTRYITNASSVIGKIAQLENPVLCRIRNFIFRNLPKSFVKKQMKQILAYDFYK
jgi:2-polyprenyl-6-methoxyphenol hydroxylase-like FAD-dependent oxidoreductase